MPPKTKPVLEDSPNNKDDHAWEPSTAILLEHLVNHTNKPNASWHFLQSCWVNNRNNQCPKTTTPSRHSLAQGI